MDITRSFIETAVDKALRDIQRDPRRSVRNLVDLGQRLSRGKYQSHFLKTAQRMLEQGDSAYYEVAQRAAGDIDHDVIKTFGINVGYNGLTRGAKRIRELEAKMGINIPWCITLEIGHGPEDVALEAIQWLIASGVELGIHTYSVFCHADDLGMVSRLLADFPMCAFLAHILPGTREAILLAELTLYRNALVMLCTEDPAYEAAAGLFGKARCLYGAYTFYDDETVHARMGRPWLDRALAGGGYFASCVAQPGTSPWAVERMREYVLAVRNGQREPIFLLELATDILFIDQVISAEPCYLGFTREGYAYTASALSGENLRTRSLVEILRTLALSTAQARLQDGWNGHGSLHNPVGR